MMTTLPFLPEKTELQIGFLPLTDCAVLVAALERGIFEKYGLQVTLQRESSWANIRDRVAFGELDAAHMLAPMPLAATLGVDGLGIPMQTAFAMGLNGSAITLSSGLMEAMRRLCPEGFATSPLQATALKKLVQTKRHRRLVLAHVYPFSQHHYLLHAWLREAGIDPDQDLELMVIPPSQMLAKLASGDIDGYCAGEPWNQMAVQQGIGEMAISSYEIWNNGPEKVLGVTTQWAERYPQTHLTLVTALLEAAQWLEHAHSRILLSRWLAQAHYLNVPERLLKAPLLGYCQYARQEPARFLPDFHCFHRYAANAPWHSQGAYFLGQMRQHGQLGALADGGLDMSRVFRMDIYRVAADACGLAYPLQDHKPEGLMQSAWIMQQASQPLAMGSTYIALHQLRADVVKMTSP